MIDGVAITQLGVASVVVGMAVWMLKLLIDGKLHTNSELAARDKQISDLLEVNRGMREALSSANETMQRIISHAPAAK